MRVKSIWKCDLCETEAHSPTSMVPPGWVTVQLGGADVLPHAVALCYTHKGELVNLLKIELLPLPKVE